MLKAGLDTTVGDHQQRWHLLDPEVLGQVGPLIDIDLAEDEGAVVLSPLEHLGEEAFDPSAGTVELGVEEDELGHLEETFVLEPQAGDAAPEG
jgi:hypothetical protein